MLQLVWCATIRLAKSVVTGMLVQSKRNFAGCYCSCRPNDSDVVSNVTFLLSASTSKVAMLHPRMTLALVTLDDTRNDSLFFPSFSISILILSFAAIFRLVERGASLLRLESMFGGGWRGVMARARAHVLYGSVIKRSFSVIAVILVLCD